MNKSSISRPSRRKLRSSASSAGRIAEIRRRREAVRAISEADHKELEGVAILVNQERATAGLAPLRRDAKLDVAAQLHAQDMALRGYFSHESPEGELFPARIARAGYPEGAPDSAVCSCDVFIQYGENIALGQPTAQRVVEAWMASPEHRENILEGSFLDVGYGKYGAYWVQDFGSMRITYAVAPKPRGQ